MVPRSALTVLTAVVAMTAGGTALADVTLDFETVPGGGPPVIFDPVADTYVPWGATLFSSQGVTGEPQFINGYPGAVTFAAALGCTYPPGHNLSVEFVPGVRYVSARVMTAEGTTVTMRALDGAGMELDAVTSAPAPADLWAGTLEVGPTAADIASVEWWPSISSSTVGVDDLTYGPAPEPATLALVGLGAAALAMRRRTRTPDGSA
jgi:hypothetical protein